MSDAARANSRFTVVADVSDGTIERRTVATGRDIYGITAPMIVGAAQALLSEKRAGVLAVSQVVDRAGLLTRLKYTHDLQVDRDAPARLAP